MIEPAAAFNALTGRLLTIIASPRRPVALHRNGFQTPDMTGETPTEDRTRRNAAEDPVESNCNVAELEASGPRAKM
jgi:hypothetical protein